MHNSFTFIMIFACKEWWVQSKPFRISLFPISRFHFSFPIFHFPFLVLPVYPQQGRLELLVSVVKTINRDRWMRTQIHGINEFSLLRQWSCSCPATSQYARPMNQKHLMSLLYCCFVTFISTKAWHWTYYSACVLFVDVEPYRLILRLHCHWKPSQGGTVLKIAPCWPLTGSVYTAIIKAVRVLSIFGHRPVVHHVIFIHHGDRFMVSSSVSNRNAQEGTKTHALQLHSHDIAVTRFWD